uniref:RNA-binding protein Tab2/Atab2 C-terminal domain-containing protein n=1 Tax=Quercus lobata TaxID=97700 RepID=A0A7N2LDH2_QUELO
MSLLVGRSSERCRFDKVGSSDGRECLKPNEPDSDQKPSLPPFFQRVFWPFKDKKISTNLTTFWPDLTNLTNSTFDHHPMRHDPMCLAGQLQVSFFPTQSAVREEVSSLETRLVFGAGLDLDLLGIEIDDKTLIPGLAVATSRARPLAAWMNGLEVCSIEAELSRASLILSVGISNRYIYATYKKTPETTNESEAWEATKKACGGLHFLEIQEDLDSDDCVGFWLLLDLPPPPV